jgi:hypothetical protein
MKNGIGKVSEVEITLGDGSVVKCLSDTFPRKTEAGPMSKAGLNAKGMNYVQTQGEAILTAMRAFIEHPTFEVYGSLTFKNWVQKITGIPEAGFDSLGEYDPEKISYRIDGQVWLPVMTSKQVEAIIAKVTAAEATPEVVEGVPTIVADTTPVEAVPTVALPTTQEEKDIANVTKVVTSIKSGMKIEKAKKKMVKGLGQETTDRLWAQVEAQVA